MHTQTLVSIDGSRLEIAEQGAHLLSWRSADGVEQLFLSPRAEFREGVAIRGGVPVIFPQFAALGPLPKHGFARTLPWTCAHSSENEPAMAYFTLQDSAESRCIWPHAFRANLIISAAAQWLTLRLEIHNPNPYPISFTAALHTYLAVSAIEAVSIEGLTGLRYRDSANHDHESLEQATALRITGEMDRIYFDALDGVTVLDKQRRIRATTEGFRDVVVWNPGAEKCAALKDMEADGYLHMLCVEAAAIGTPITLSPAATWQAAQYLTVS